MKKSIRSIEYVRMMNCKGKEMFLCTKYGVSREYYHINAIMTIAIDVINGFECN